ncbi:MAG: pyruvate kinase [Candidatus Omnitrophota bacterium]
MKVLCTLGPSTLNEIYLRRFSEIKVDLLRINLSHTELDSLEDTILFIRKHTSIPICLDSEGAQIRTGRFMENDVYLEENKVVQLNKKMNGGTSDDFSLYPDYVLDKFELGDLLSIDFNSAVIQVIKRDIDGNMMARVLSPGKIGNNKAVTLDRDIGLLPLTDKDKKALAIGRRLNINNVALSFAGSTDDVEEIRKHCIPGTFVISKIESKKALNNLEHIINSSNAILIDRGDLSREVGVENIPYWQKHILYTSKRLNREVYVATNLLESMVTSPVPTRAEVNDIYNTMVDGSDGLVLAAETAIGKFPLQCVSMIQRMIHSFEERKTSIPSLDSSVVSLAFCPPHGGKLVYNIINPEKAGNIHKLPSLILSEEDILDCEQIAIGTYSPITGPMTQEELSSVLNDLVLPGGLAWTLPIILQVFKKDITNLGDPDKVLLRDRDGNAKAILNVSQIYKLNMPELVYKWFGTNDLNHPGVDRVMQKGDWAISGEVLLLNYPKTTLYAEYMLTPQKIRYILDKKGWTSVVGFHTRNVPHKVHEYIQLKALERTLSDGLLITPVSGPKKQGDFKIGPIIKSYQWMIDNDIFPKNKAMVSCFNTYSRYSGQREAVFTALCRKNMGCNYFIIGRDHTGVGNHYSSVDVKKIFNRVGNIGITPVFFDEISFNHEENLYQEGTYRNNKSISGAQARESLKLFKKLPEWFMREEIQDIIFDHLRKDVSGVFY